MATIRLATTSDAAAIAEIYAPYCDATVISFEETAPTPEEMQRRIAAIGATRPWIVLEDSACGASEAQSGRASASGGGAPRASENARVIGYAYASAHHERAAYRWSVSTAIYIGRDHHRRGAGRALYTTLFEVLAHLGYRQATAGITLPNPASVGLHAAFGFAPVGVYRQIGFKMEGWHDVGWFQAEIQSGPERPADPRSIHEMIDTPEWHDAVKRGLHLYVHHT
jgi:phosphinothricin acetyltransferase